MNGISHFAINADDVPTSMAFCEKVFGWRFDAFGSAEDFHQITTPDGPRGAIQRRRELIPGHPTVGFECTIEVADVDDTARIVINAGGRILMDKATIPGVGDLIFFADPAGNVVGAIRYVQTRT